MATQDCSDDPALLTGHEAETGISGEIGGNPFPSIGVVIQADAFGVPPQFGHFVVVLDGHLGDLEPNSNHWLDPP